jgi:hypothetical protein
MERLLALAAGRFRRDMENGPFIDGLPGFTY